MDPIGADQRGEWLTLKGCARSLKCSTRLLRRARDAGQLEVVKLGDRWQRVHRTELARWARLHRVPPTVSASDSTQRWLAEQLKREADRQRP